MKKHIYGLVGFCLLVFAQAAAWSQQAPSEQAPANVTGKWTLYCNDPNGTTSAKYLDLQQEGTNIKGHFKGPNQSGGVEGTINEQHLVVRTKPVKCSSFAEESTVQESEESFRATPSTEPSTIAVAQEPFRGQRTQ